MASVPPVLPLLAPPSPVGHQEVDRPLSMPALMEIDSAATVPAAPSPDEESPAAVPEPPMAMRESPSQPNAPVEHADTESMDAASSRASSASLVAALSSRVASLEQLCSVLADRVASAEGEIRALRSELQYKDVDMPPLQSMRDIIGPSPKIGSAAPNAPAAAATASLPPAASGSAFVSTKTLQSPVMQPAGAGAVAVAPVDSSDSAAAKAKKKRALAKTTKNKDASPAMSPLVAAALPIAPPPSSSVVPLPSPPASSAQLLSPSVVRIGDVSYRSAASLLSASLNVADQQEPQPFGQFFVRANALENDQLATQTMATAPPMDKSLKRKRSQEASKAAASSAAAAAAASSPSSSPAVAPSSANWAAPTDPVAGRYDDPSLIDVADANRDVEALGDSAPGIYKDMLALERELREMEEDRAHALAHPLQPKRASHLAAHGTAAKHVHDVLESEREAMTYSEVLDLKVDAHTGQTIVLAAPDQGGTSGDSTSYTKSNARWISVKGLEGLTPAMVPRALTQKLKLHQLQGVKFILDNLLGRYQPDHTPTGCILADAMGLGKTLCVLAALHIFAQITMDRGGARPCFLLVGPPTVLKHWKNESLKLSGWLSDSAWEGTDLTNHASGQSWLLPTQALDTSVRPEERGEVLKNWREQQGLLLIGYDMLREICTTGGGGGGSAHASSTAAEDSIDMEDVTPTSATFQANSDSDVELLDEGDLPAGAASSHTAVSRDLLSYFQHPGPDVLVMDESHKIRNMQSEVHKRLALIPPRRRVLLSGYPLQNNLSELYAMIDFARPAHLLNGGHNLGSQRDFAKFFELPVLKAQVSQDILERRKARRRCWMLFDWMQKERLMLRRSNAILVKQLPCPLHEIIQTVRFSRAQWRVYTGLLEMVKSNLAPIRSLEIVQIVSMLLCHPQVLRQHCTDLPTVTHPHAPAVPLVGGAHGDAMVDAEEAVHSAASATTSAAFKRMFVDEFLPSSTLSDLSPNHSAKTVLALSILLQAKAIGDHVVIFSKWIHTLSYLEALFARWNDAFFATLQTPEEKMLRASERITWGRFDGSTPQKDRQELIQQFGPPAGSASAAPDQQSHRPAPDVLLISTLCGEGINLCRANRVILMDVSWNPNNDLQAAHRIYRYGQTKPAFVYRLVVAASMEEKMLMKQIRKEELTKWSLERRNVSRNVAVAQASAAPTGTGEPMTPKEARDAAAQTDPTHIRRFFDPPPTMEETLARPTTNTLTPEIMKDPVTRKLIRSYSNPSKKSRLANQIAGEDVHDEPLTWILSAFEQHSLMEDDTSTSALYGDEEADASAETESSSSVAAAIAANTVDLISPATTPVILPSAPPKYWFGAVPAGMQLAPSKHRPAATAAAASSAASPAGVPISAPAPGTSSPQFVTLPPPATGVPSIFASVPKKSNTTKPSASATHAAATNPTATATAATASAPSRVIVSPSRRPGSAARPNPPPQPAVASFSVPIPPRPAAPAAAPPPAPAATSPAAPPTALEREIASRKDKLAHLADARKQRRSHEDTAELMAQQADKQKLAERELERQRAAQQAWQDKRRAIEEAERRGRAAHEERRYDHGAASSSSSRSHHERASSSSHSHSHGSSRDRDRHREDRSRSRDYSDRRAYPDERSARRSKERERERESHERDRDRDARERR